MNSSPKQLEIKDFDYDLPDEKIAKHPLAERDASKLLIYKDGAIKADNFTHLANYLPENALIIFNNTKVVEARLLFKKATGTTIEIFCLEPADDYADITTAMLQHKKVLWKCLAGNAKKWKDEILVKKILHNGKEMELSAKKISRRGENFIIEFSWNDEQLSFAEVLHIAGVIPLPPYMHRDADDDDKSRYQTVYAKYDGSVAAPTAGLHFTDKVFEKLSAKNIERNFVTLHVGAGTFKPVKTATIEAHEMHSEFFEVSAALIQKLIHQSNQNIIAVGTTSLRTLESLYWMGIKVGRRSPVKSQRNITIEDITIHQWDAYELNDENISLEDALHALLEWMKANKHDKLIAKTQIIIAPPYKLKVANVLITNFHQPKSTLLLLVAAVIGNDWKKVYDYALNNNFRFLSYGDSCLFFSS
ncbi:S-adenosylmethionine:tRNA ribosyltransferase-isomerase [Parafilimonas sp.]|uniref:S-adenosylmethionine:tRNA ribosyltransferase-isomerase n=1 Tax=Parafilimonas sp. TaxID=1969739 RepID=UPI003F7ECF80